MIKYVGPLRMCWGTDSLWFGSPQSEIVALRGFEFSREGEGALQPAARARRRRVGPAHQCAERLELPPAHPHVKNWPTDGKPHPERTIRNRIFGRNAAEAYKVDADAQLNKIKCDDVQEFRDKGYLEGDGPLLRAPLASNSVYGERTPEGVMHELWSNPWSP